MNKKTCVLFVIVGILFFVESGNALRCYKCDAANDDKCEKGRSSLPTTECAPHETKCGTFVYDVLAGSSKVLATGYQRGCAIESGYCDFVTKGANMLLRGATGGDTGIEQRRCDLCDQDLCNSTEKISSLLSLSILILISFNVAIFF